MLILLSAGFLQGNTVASGIQSLDTMKSQAETRRDEVKEKVDHLFDKAPFGEKNGEQKTIEDSPDLATSHEFTTFATTCSKLPISKVEASGYIGGFDPLEAVDDKLSTKWINTERGSWIEIDLGSIETICSVGAAWVFGKTIKYNLAISVSTDGSSFSEVFRGTSSGTTRQIENYDFSDTIARYVKITVNGNNRDSFARISELAVYGESSTEPPLPPSPTSEICGNGIDDDLDGKIDSEDSDCAQPPSPTSEICGNGIDDDLDGKIDSEDSDCAQPPSPTSEICGNGIDDDL